MAHISWPTAFGQAALTDESRAFAESLGIGIVFEEVYDLSPTADTTAAILNAQATGANVIWTNTLAFGPSARLNGLNSLGVRDQFVVAGPYVATDLSSYAFVADPAFMAGMYGVTPFRWWNEAGHPGIQYLAQVHQTAGRDAKVQGVGYIGVVAAVDLIKHAFEVAILDVGFETLTGQALHDAPENMGTYETLDSIMTVDYSTGSRSVHFAQVIQIQGGPDKFVTVQDFGGVPDLRPRWPLRASRTPRIAPVGAIRGVRHATRTMLKLNNVEVVCSNVILVLRGVSLEVPPGKIVSMLGANGAGKTTTLKAISGLAPPGGGTNHPRQRGFNGERLDRQPPEAIVRRGVVQVLEGRLFPHLSVEENLLAGALIRPSGADIGRDLKAAYAYFPRLRHLRRRVSGYLSGGEQQMLVIGRGLMARPRLMMLDEPSLGLAPLLVEEIFRVIRRINEEAGMSILLVEQNARVALDVADYAYVMETGRVMLDGPAAQLKENEDIKEFYPGLTQLGERKSYRDVKHCMRRKRWLG